jgi:hypothetical protein
MSVFRRGVLSVHLDFFGVQEFILQIDGKAAGQKN